MTTNPYITGVSDGGAHIAFLCSHLLQLPAQSLGARKESNDAGQAVRKLTFDPHAVGIPNRGLLKTGMAADLTILILIKCKRKRKSS